MIGDLRWLFQQTIKHGGEFRLLAQADLEELDVTFSVRSELCFRRQYTYLWPAGESHLACKRIGHLAVVVQRPPSDNDITQQAIPPEI